MVRVKIIRHSERFDYSHPLRWLFCFGHYWSDAPLTNNGYKIANSKGQQIATSDIDPKYIYTSPYSRTMATSTEIGKSFPHAAMKIEPLLSEYQPYFGHNITLYPNGIPTTFDGEFTEFYYPETYAQFNNRVQYIMEMLMEKNKTIGDFIVVTHGELLKTYIIYLQNKFPDLLLQSDETPYLTILSFEYNDNLEIIKDSVRVDTT